MEDAYLWMAVPLVDRRVRAEKVIVLTSFNIPDMHPLSFIQYNREWTIVMCTIALLLINILQPEITGTVSMLLQDFPKAACFLQLTYLS